MFIFECQCQHFQMAFCLGDYNKGLCHLVLTSSSESDDRTNFCKQNFSQVFHNSYNRNYHTETWQGMCNNGIALIFLIIFEKIA